MARVFTLALHTLPPLSPGWFPPAPQPISPSTAPMQTRQTRHSRSHPLRSLPRHTKFDPSRHRSIIRSSLSMTPASCQSPAGMLEKKSSSSMDKDHEQTPISAQRKAQEMRGSVLIDHAPQVARTSHKALSLRKTPQIGSSSDCFTCNAF